jgi:hypothetical protein
MTDTANRYKIWPIEEFIREYASRIIPIVHGVNTGDRDALLFSVAISLKRIVDSLEALNTVIALK